MSRNFFVLCIFVIYSFLHSATALDIDDDENPQQQIVSAQRSPKVEFFTFFSASFWEKNDFLNPTQFNELILRHSKPLLYDLPSSEVIDTIVTELSASPIINEIISLANAILSKYALKKSHSGPLLFDPYHFFDRRILTDAVAIFAKTTFTPDPHGAKNQEWIIQAFCKKFYCIWFRLNGTEEDVSLNQSLQQEIAFALDLHPTLRLEDVINTLYPNLTEYIKARVSQKKNFSGKPVYSVFLLSLMEALTDKVYQQNVMMGSFGNNEIEQTPTSNSTTIISLPASKPNRPIVEDKIQKLKERNYNNRGRRNSLEFDANGKLINPKKTRKSPQKEDDESSDEEIDYSSFSFMPDFILPPSPF